MWDNKKINRNKIWWENVIEFESILFYATNCVPLLYLFLVDVMFSFDQRFLVLFFEIPLGRILALLDKLDENAM